MISNLFCSFKIIVHISNGFDKLNVTKIYKEPNICNHKKKCHIHIIYILIFSSTYLQ